MTQFDDVEKLLVRHVVITISLQFLYFLLLIWFLSQDGTMIVSFWTGVLGITALSAFFEVFWKLLPNLKYHQRNKLKGGHEYRRKVEASLKSLGLRSMFRQHWFVRNLDDILNDKKL